MCNPIDNGNCKLCQEKNEKINENCSLCFQYVLDDNGYKICSFCLDNYINKSIECICDKGYTLIDQYKCETCPDNCKVCDKDKTCIECMKGYTLFNGECYAHCSIEGSGGSGGVINCNSCKKGYQLIDNECIKCPNNCLNCTDNINCIICDKYFGLNNENKCIPCPEHCEKCEWNSEYEKLTCLECEKSGEYNSPNNYILGRYNECVRCVEIEEIGGKGCIKCEYENDFDIYRCFQCLGNTSGYINVQDTNKDYAFILNEEKCLSNLNKSYEFLHGCLIANYDYVKKKYKCISCKENFIFIKNENRCLLPEEIH